MSKQPKEFTQQDYDNLCDVFSHPGYKYIIESLEELKEALQEAAVDNAVTNDQWQFLRGQIAQMRAFMGYEDFIHALWKDMQAMELEDDASDPV